MDLIDGNYTVPVTPFKTQEDVFYYLENFPFHISAGLLFLIIMENVNYRHFLLSMKVQGVPRNMRVCIIKGLHH